MAKTREECMERTGVYVDLDISQEAYLEDGVIAGSIYGKLGAPGYGGQAAAVREVMALDVSIERKLLIFGAVTEHMATISLEHTVAKRALSSGNPIDRLFH